MTDEEENDELTKFHGYLMPFTQNSWQFLKQGFIFFLVIVYRNFLFRHKYLCCLFILFYIIFSVPFNEKVELFQFINGFLLYFIVRANGPEKTC